MEFTRASRLRDILAHPLGSDIVRQLARQMGRSPRWLTTFGGIRISWLARFLGSDVVDSLVTLLNSHPDRPGPGPEVKQWWQDAVFYQIYPRSFADSDGDGIGDLRGIIDRLDYLAELGVDCLWLSPIFDSPNEDMGYDIRNYRAIMSEMGTLEDADALIDGCHERGMRIILDLVVNHTSAEHPWARAAAADPDGPYGDYYFLRQGQREPNNWRSFFSGPAWRYLPETDRWVLHLFAPGQWDLNWDNPAVRGEAADIVSWWLDRGVDGFRLDVINLISKSPGLPEGSEIIGELLQFTGIEHYFFGPKLHDYLVELRRNGFTRRRPPRTTVRHRHTDGTLGDRLPPDPVGIMVGEAIGIGVESGALLARSNQAALDLLFNFDVLESPGHSRFDTYTYDPNYLKEYYLDYAQRSGPGDWLAVFWDNHDNPRMLSKIAGGAESDPAIRTAVGKLLATLQLTMRGTPFLYQGQEIAAINQPFSSMSELRDIESINRYRALLEQGWSPQQGWESVLAGTRDHARVPMQWEPDGGFTTGTPWLAGCDEAPGFSVAEQYANHDSVWWWYHALIALRRRTEDLRSGDLRFHLPRRRHYLAYVRGGRYFIEMNLSGRMQPRPKPPFECDLILGPPRNSHLAPYESSVSCRR